MPFVDEHEQTIFTLNKSRSAPIYGCCACYMNFCWHLWCKCACCGFSEDYSNLTVAVGDSAYYIKNVYTGASGHPKFEIRDLKNGSKLVFTIRSVDLGLLLKVNSNLVWTRVVRAHTTARMWFTMSRMPTVVKWPTSPSSGAVDYQGSKVSVTHSQLCQSRASFSMLQRVLQCQLLRY